MTKKFCDRCGEESAHPMSAFTPVQYDIQTDTVKAGREYHFCLDCTSDIQKFMMNQSAKRHVSVKD